MEHIPRRRHGIDGLSHRPTLAQLDSSPQQVVDKPTPIRPALRKRPHSTKPSDGFPLSGNVSHPSLPQQHSRIQDKPVSSPRKLLGYPFAPGFDRRILRLGIIATVLDVRFWIVLFVPIILVRLTRLTSLAPAQVVELVRSFLVARNYVWVVVGVGFLYLVIVLSVLIVAIARQVMTAIKIRKIDHRVSRGYILVRHAISNMLTTALSWLIDLALISVVVVAMVGAVYWFTVTSAPWLAPWRSYAVGLVVLKGLFLLSVLVIRRKLQRSMLATTQLRLAAIQIRSFKLIWHNLPLSILAFSLAVLEFVVVASLIVVISVSLYVHSPTFTTVAARLGVWLLGLSAVTVLWLGSVLWQSAHWAGFYHLVVLRCKKDQVSDYLVPSGPLKLRIWPALAAAGVVLVVLFAYFGAAFAVQGQVRRVGQQIKASIPADVSRLVPGIE